MIPEIGHFCLVVALCLAAAQSFFGLAGSLARKPSWMAVVKPATAGQFVFVAIAFALLTLTVATILKLVPPAATKLAIDYVLGDRSLPAVLTETLPLPQSRLSLLVCIAVAVVVVSILAALMHLVAESFQIRSSTQAKSIL